MCDTCPDPSPSYCNDCKKTHWYHEICNERKLRENNAEAEYLSNMIEYDYLIAHNKNFAEYMRGYCAGRKCELWSPHSPWKLTGLEKNWAYKEYNENKR